ncbi:Cyclophilin-like [Sanguibacter gelidistatuariae]|uniref:Cyclophilin-like n=1 Tax=Sanguibacter gelidistatuariae TaxID=1814289 RepID=A0A1G6Y6F0_9MICO|nr:cyclophilin-like fold protein [Sanguibacter gelidistatuariae]SDD85978.1 Cyclophilin-like [Sanguibacter gelidistatuariae]
MKIELTIDDTRVEAELNDHPVARELAQALPLDLVFNDFNQVEKVASLGRSLTLRGVPDADAPGPGEIGYYAPTQGLVLFYGSPGRWPGLVRMGRFSYDLSALRALPDGTRIHIALAPTDTP